jgi:Skp family chaperone for outer membrane proteins
MRRRITKILIAFVLSLFLCVSLFAQNKIAVVDSDIFYNEKEGITELVIANKKLELEFNSATEEIKVLNEKLSKLVNHLQNHGWVNYPESHLNKSEVEVLEAQELSKKIKTIADETKPKFEKRKVELIEPINRKIGDKAQEFAKNNGYTMILDISKTDDSSGFICRFDNLSDVTKDFIKFCNEEFEKEKAQKK